MTKNMGTADKTIRVIVALAMLALSLAVKLPVWLIVVLVLLSVVFLVTSAISFCPLYPALKLTTRKKG